MLFNLHTFKVPGTVSEAVNIRYEQRHYLIKVISQKELVLFLLQMAEKKNISTLIDDRISQINLLKTSSTLIDIHKKIKLEICDQHKELAAEN